MAVGTPIAAGSLSAQTVVDLVRRILKDDDDSKPRWPDTIMLVYVNLTIKAIAARRYDYFLTTAGTLTSVGELTGLSDNTPFTPVLLKSMADYICYRALLEDSSDPKNAERAAEHKRLFEEGMALNV